MPIERNRSLFPHVFAAMQLRESKKTASLVISLTMYVDGEQVNPMKRVAPAEIAQTYDTEKYA